MAPLDPRHVRPHRRRPGFKTLIEEIGVAESGVEKLYDSADLLPVEAADPTGEP